MAVQIPIPSHTFGSMARLARTMLMEGHSEREVLAQCYGVPFPEEVLLLSVQLRERRAPVAIYPNLPWQLIIPIDEGGPPDEPKFSLMYEDEKQLYDRYPDLIPLLLLHGGGEETLSSRWLCYGVDELGAGHSTVWSVPQSPKASEPAYCDESLAAALHLHFSEALANLEAQLISPRNCKVGVVDQVDVDNGKQQLERVEELLKAPPISLE